MSGAFRIYREHRVVARLRKAGATSPEQAVDLGKAGVRPGPALDTLCKGKAVLKTDEDHFYVDEARAAHVLTRRRQWALFFFLILVILWSAYMLLLPAYLMSK